MPAPRKIRLKIASASCNQTGGDWPRNLGNICRAIDLAAADGADILSLEELGLPGYERGDDFACSDNAQTFKLLRLIADYAASMDKNLVVSVGHPWHHADKTIKGDAKNPLFNRLDLPFDTQTFITGGEIVAMSAKRYLFNYERGYEKRHFEEWGEGTITIKLPDGKKIPFGAPVVRIGKINLHHIICEEYWIGAENAQSYARDNPLAQIAKKHDIAVALCPSASPPAAGKIDTHRALCALASKHCGVFVLTDGLGSSGSTFALSGARLMAQRGKIISEGRRLSFRDVCYTSQIVTVAPLRKKTRPHATMPHVFRERHAPAVQDGPAAWEKSPRRDFEDETRNECLWLFDYLRKNNIHGIAQALSGGADSAWNAAKVRVMAELGINELGMKGFLDALGNPAYAEDVLKIHKRKGDKPALATLMRHMLTCVYMGTGNSSDDTRRAAKELAEGLGATYHERDVQPLLDQHIKIYAEDVEGTAYENVQARIRQVMIMIFANAENKIAIANPNLDEARNGYATWGGDLHGGMIGGNAHKDKALELQHLRLLHDHGLDGVAPVKSLARVLKNRPSAELQPKKAGKVAQYTEDELGRSFGQMRVIAHYMLYDRAPPARRNTPVEVFQKCRKHPAFRTDSIETLHRRIDLSYEKWGQAQFKIHGSPIAATYGKNVDHQSSLRTPNTSAAHRPERAQLTLYCLSEMARRDKIKFEKLTGGPALDALHSRALIDGVFAGRLRMNLAALYAHIRKNGFAEIAAPTPMQDVITRAARRKKP